jgi:Cu2+-containing amine oxidase
MLPQVKTAHPLDPLCHEEFQLALQLLENLKNITNGSEWNVNRISLCEPSKIQVLQYEANHSLFIDRVVICILLNNLTNKTYECKISLTNNKVLSW